jgi:hypothetical protein
MRRIFRPLVLLVWLIVGSAAAQQTAYTLTDGTSITGEIGSADERGVIFRTPGQPSSERIPYIRFTQEALKQLQKNSRAAPHVEIYLDVDVSQRAQKREVRINTWEKPSREMAGSFLGGFLSTGLGLLVLFLVYGASIYAAYEIAIVRAYPWPLVCGVAAVFPLLGPLVFLCLPTRVVSQAEEGESEWKSYEAEEAARAAATAEAEASGEGAAGLQLAAAVAEAAGPALPATERFPRGQFTFNRRFFETKFPSWFSVIRRDADKDLRIILRTARGTYTTTRFSRISANDITLQVTEGAASRDVVVPFQEVQEVILKHKDSPDH